MGMNVKKMVRIGLLTALATTLTMFPQIPNGAGGYVHFGDSIIYLAAIFFGPYAGGFVGAVGHALADGMAGYQVFVLPTFIIKGLLGIVVGKIAAGHIKSPGRLLCAAGAALALVTAGYFVAEWFLLGKGAAYVSLVSSPLQWLMSMVACAVLLPLFQRIRKSIGF